MLADDFLLGVSLDSASPVIPSQNVSLGVEDKYRVVLYAFDEQAKDFVALGRRSFIAVTIRSLLCKTSFCQMDTPNEGRYIPQNQIGYAWAIQCSLYCS